MPIDSAVSFHLWRALDIERLVINGKPARFTYGPGEIIRSVVIPQQELPDAHCLWVQSAETRFELRTEMRPQAVVLDPDKNLLFR